MPARTWIDAAVSAAFPAPPGREHQGASGVEWATISALRLALEGWPAGQAERDRLAGQFRSQPHEGAEAVGGSRGEIRQLLLRAVRDGFVSDRRKNDAVLALANLYVLGVGDEDTLKSLDNAWWLLPIVREYVRDALLGLDGIGGPSEFPRRSFDVEVAIHAAPVAAPPPDHSEPELPPEPDDDRDVLRDGFRSIEGSWKDEDAVSLAVDAALDVYWGSVAGSLRRLNLKREAIENLGVPMPEGQYVRVTQPDVDPALLPSSLARRAGRALATLGAFEAPNAHVRFVGGISDRLREIASSMAPRSRAERAKADGFADSTARVARECLTWATATLPGSPEWARLYAEAGIALAADLDNGTETHRRAAVNVGLERLLSGLAKVEGIPPSFREAAVLVTEGRASADRVLSLLDNGTPRQADGAAERGAGAAVVRGAPNPPTTPPSADGGVRLFPFKESLETATGGPKETGYVEAMLVRADGRADKVRLGRRQYEALASLVKRGVVAMKSSEASRKALGRLADVLLGWGVETGRDKPNVLRLIGRLTVHPAEGVADRTKSLRRFAREAEREARGQT